MTIDDSERSILEDRARALARPRREQLSVIEKYALFERGGVRYAIEPRFVFAVAHAPEPTPLPGSARYWCGVSSVHGELLALVDLALLLDGAAANEVAASEPRPDSEDHLVLVLGEARREFGLVIDALLETSSLSLELARVPSGDASSHLIVGTSVDGTRVVRGDALLSDPRLFIQANHSTES
ncbi:MAG: putative chemotaxis protein CheW [Myxococcaceae bacterium]|nr:putative chemotaxis protein CheW [Myxococcaceae bacterium]